MRESAAAQSMDTASSFSPTPCDVLVIGGGPAGSTVATRLAGQGHDVLLLDKDAHPRFHIGESLLPANLRLFEELGVAEAVRRIGIVKRAAEFESPWHDQRQAFQFSEGWNKDIPHAYQVRRSEFDQLLLEHAARRGVRVLRECRVTDVDLEATPERAQATARMADGSHFQCRPRFVVDASGRDTFLASRMKIKHRNPRHNSVAVFGHYRGVERNPGLAEGNITIYWFEHGWFWFIPLLDGVTSIGMVTWPYFMKTRGERSLDQFLQDGVELVPELARRLRNAVPTKDAEAAGNYTYSSERNHGRNYALIGDAFCFLDPVFSSGVMMAMQGGFDAADAIDIWLRHPDRQATALRTLDRRLKLGPREFSWFIYRMTNPVMRDLFMQPRNFFRVKDALISMLAGDIYGNTPIWPSLRLFKLIYYLSSLRQLPRTARAWRRRKANIAPVAELRGLS